MTTPASRTDEHGRPEPDFSGDELTLLAQFLDYQRATLAWKTSDIPDNDARTRIAASSLSLGGLLGHLAFVEDLWFTRVVGEQPAPEPWASMDWDERPDGDHELIEHQPLAEVRSLWEERCARSRAVVEHQTQAHGPGALDTSSTRCGAGASRSVCAGCCCTWSRSMRATTATRTCSGRPWTARSGNSDVARQSAPPWAATASCPKSFGPSHRRT